MCLGLEHGLIGGIHSFGNLDLLVSKEAIAKYFIWLLFSYSVCIKDFVVGFGYTR